METSGCRSSELPIQREFKQRCVEMTQIWGLCAAGRLRRSLFSCVFTAVSWRDVQLCLKNLITSFQQKNTPQGGQAGRDSAINSRDVFRNTHESSPPLPPSLTLPHRLSRGPCSLPHLHNQPLTLASDTC